MEVLAANVWASLRERFPGAGLIANRRSNRYLPLWWMLTLPRVAFALASRRADTVLTGDALAYALFRPLLVAARVPHATMVMGLDITYHRRLYRAVVHPALRRAPRVIAISEATAREAVNAGVRRDRVSVVRLGLPLPPLHRNDKPDAGRRLRAEFDIAPDDVIALTVGRLVRRKGVLWFVQSVLPHLPPSMTYVIAGDGPTAGPIRDAVDNLGLAPRVRMLGAVEEDMREHLLRGADVFIQPNVPVPGDMEGFGLAVLEAAMRGTLTVASGIEGILDAVIDEQTGILLPPADADAWVQRLSALGADRTHLRDLGWQYGMAARASYAADRMGDQLAELLRER